MKPDWKNAPEWANWLAMDANGWWFWYEREPFELDDEWRWHVGSRCTVASKPSDWENTKEQRCTD